MRWWLACDFRCRCNDSRLPHRSGKPAAWTVGCRLCRTNDIVLDMNVCYNTGTTLHPGAIAMPLRISATIPQEVVRDGERRRVTRPFLQCTAAVAGAACLTPHVLIGSQAPPARTAVDQVPLGNTGLKLSRLGFGTGSNSGNVQKAWPARLQRPHSLRVRAGCHLH